MLDKLLLYYLFHKFLKQEIFLHTCMYVNDGKNRLCSVTYSMHCNIFPFLLIFCSKKLPEKAQLFYIKA